MVQNRFIKFLILGIFVFCSSAQAITWDLFDEDFASISEWDDQDTGVGASTTETFDGKTVLKQTTTAASTANVASLRLLGDFSFGSNDFTMELSFYIQDHVVGATDFDGSMRDNDGFSASEPLSTQYTINTGLLGVTSADCGASACTANIEATIGKWHKLRIVQHHLSGDADVAVYLDDHLYMFIVSPVSAVGFTANTVFISVRGSNSGVKTIYFDYLRYSSEMELPQESALKIGSENIVTRFEWRTLTNGINASENLKIQGVTGVGQGIFNLDVVTVPTSDPNASKTRIFDGSSVRSLMKMPESMPV